MPDGIEMHERVAKLEAYKKDVTRRVEALEAIFETIHELATNTAELATSMNNIKTTVEKIDDRVKDIENIPKNRYNYLVKQIVGAAIGIIVGYFLNMYLN